MAERKAFLLRLDPRIHDALQRWAALIAIGIALVNQVELERLAQCDLRSVNAEIEYLLREALARRGVRLGAGAATGRADDAPD